MRIINSYNEAKVYISYFIVLKARHLANPFLPSGYVSSLWMLSRMITISEDVT